MATEAHGAEDGGLVFHPMDQFIVKPLFGNGDVGAFHDHQRDALDGADGHVCIIVLLVFGTSRRAIVPSRSQSIAEMTVWLRLQNG